MPLPPATISELIQQQEAASSMDEKRAYPTSSKRCEPKKTPPLAPSIKRKKKTRRLLQISTSRTYRCFQNRTCRTGQITFDLQISKGASKTAVQRPLPEWR